MIVFKHTNIGIWEYKNKSRKKNKMGKIFKEIIAKELQISLITLMCTFKGAQ